MELAEYGTDAIQLVTDPSRRAMLRDVGELSALLGAAVGRHLYLDITGLSNHVWPAILKVARATQFQIQVMYVEPRDYAYSASPRENVFFDLSELISGISPIPQFSNLREPDEEEVSLIPLLGFEGARFKHLLEDIQPESGNVNPVVGVPGFRAEYPFFTYQGNQMPLKDSGAWQDIRFAKANCPFSLYYCLQDIVADYTDDWFFKIGLIGTKPHALGAVLYCLQHEERVELIYDHTIRKADRSTGQSTCLVYPVSEFLDRMAGA
ncbi:hypothetical protein [Sphingomonas sp.]|jgi:hypothetical protein|uniref:hypothetical protein n=1 Tax=Sphingomonas sp. TaxID=28214 RepID=UPI002E33D286|nr:hypothetical protein [Sphingomonas sp.]HEX4693555.1 hypothetical protein [Sphingomonas sp.]